MRVLIVDDEEDIRESIQKLLSLEGIASASAPDGRVALEALMAEVYDAVVTDLKMPNVDGQELLEKVLSAGLRCPVIMISALGDINDAVKALKTGAADYLIKPFDPDELIYKIRAAISNLRRSDEIEAVERTRIPGVRLVGESDAARNIKRVIEKVAKSDTTVLITGESGVGKEVVARQIHALSSRATEPFVAVNIGAVHESLMESELFGHEKGAFTGADERRIGLFELAGSGSLFLDEIGEMPLGLQVKLLRVLQERKIRRLGGSMDIPIAARFLSATNQNVEAMLKTGRMREDLYYRLNVVRIFVPPLRERKDDIPLLSQFLLEKLCTRMARPDARITPEAIRKLMEYSFPGNIRELENVLERALIYADGDVIAPRDLYLGDWQGLRADISPGEENGTSERSPGSLEDIERQAIEKALAKWAGNRSKAATELGISRGTIIKKIKLFGLE